MKITNNWPPILLITGAVVAALGLIASYFGKTDLVETAIYITYGIIILFFVLVIKEARNS